MKAYPLTAAYNKQMFFIIRQVSHRKVQYRYGVYRIIINSNCQERLSMKKAGRPRDENKRQLILDATFSLLSTQSVRAVTIEKISEQAGVGKTTVYRWWENKCSLIIEATMQQLLVETAIDNRKSPKILLHNHFVSLVNFFSKREGEIFLELLSEAQFDSDVLDELRGKIIEPRRLAIKQLIIKGVSQNLFKKQTNIEWLIDAIYGPIYYRALIKHKRLDQKFSHQHINYWLELISQ